MLGGSSSWLHAACRRSGNASGGPAECDPRRGPTTPERAVGRLRSADSDACVPVRIVPARPSELRPMARDFQRARQAPGPIQASVPCSFCKGARQIAHAGGPMPSPAAPGRPRRPPSGRSPWSRRRAVLSPRDAPESRPCRGGERASSPGPRVSRSDRDGAWTSHEARAGSTGPWSFVVTARLLVTDPLKLSASAAAVTCPAPPGGTTSSNPITVPARRGAGVMETAATAGIAAAGSDCTKHGGAPARRRAQGRLVAPR